MRGRTNYLETQTTQINTEIFNPQQTNTVRLIIQTEGKLRNTFLDVGYLILERTSRTPQLLRTGREADNSTHQLTTQSS